MKIANHIDNLRKTIKRLDSSFFYYDLDFLESHLSEMNNLRDQDIKLWFACKANPLSSILKLFRNLHFGVDVASLGELEQVTRSGLKPQDIISTGPSKSKKYIRSLLENEINCVVIESEYQLKWLNEIAKDMGIKAKCLLRAQFEWEGGSSVLGGNDVTCFGMDRETVSAIDLKEYPEVEVIGFHVFQWGNILDLKRLETIWDKICLQIKEIASQVNVDLKVIDLGGGIGIPYEKGEQRVPFDKINEVLVSLKKKHKLQKIWMELGRYAVGECGLYLSQVIDRKKTRGVDILVLDGGINHIARPALTGQSFPCEVLYHDESKENNSKTKNFQVHGPLCTSLDKLGTFELPEDVDYGDWLIFKNSGAYGFTEAMPFFLCHNLPAEIVSYKGDLMTPRTIKTSTDWLV